MHLTGGILKQNTTRDSRTKVVVRAISLPAWSLVRLIIKHTLCCSDEVTIVSIQENPYMQYLVGLRYFQENPIFSPELFVTLRKRIDDKFFNDIMLSMH